MLTTTSSPPSWSTSSAPPSSSASTQRRTSGGAFTSLTIRWWPNRWYFSYPSFLLGGGRGRAQVGVAGLGDGRVLEDWDQGLPRRQGRDLEENGFQASDISLGLLFSKSILFRSLVSRKQCQQIMSLSDRSGVWTRSERGINHWKKVQTICQVPTPESQWCCEEDRRVWLPSQGTMELHPVIQVEALRALHCPILFLVGHGHKPRPASYCVVS